MTDSFLKAEHNNILLAGDDERYLYQHRYKFWKAGLGKEIEVETSPAGMLSKIQAGGAKPSMVILYASTAQEVTKYSVKLKAMPATANLLTSLLLIIGGANKTTLEDMAQKQRLFKKIFTRVPHVNELLDKYSLN
jgi:hypothetical protein